MDPRWTIASSALALVFVAHGAYAQGTDPVAAEALFREAKKLMAENRYAEACPKLAESQRLDPGGGTLLNLALCHEAEGKTATAWSELREAIRVSRADRPDRVKIAEEHLAAIEPRLPKLIISVPEASRAPGLAVSVDGSPRNEATWGSPLPIDPGSHRVVASAEGKKSWEGTAGVEPGETRTIEIPPLQAAPVKPPTPVTVASVHDRPAATPAGRTWGLVIGGVGLAAIGVGAYFGLSAKSKHDDANAICPQRECASASAVQLNEDAGTSATISTIAIGVGLAAVAAGIYLYVTSKPAPAAVSFGFGTVSGKF
jgi:hypothetical protein